MTVKELYGVLARLVLEEKGHYTIKTFDGVLAFDAIVIRDNERTGTGAVVLCHREDRKRALSA